MSLGLTQLLTEMSKDGRCVGLSTLPSSCADFLIIWEPQPPGTFRACNGIVLPLPLLNTIISLIWFRSYIILAIGGFFKSDNCLSFSPFTKVLRGEKSYKIPKPTVFCIIGRRQDGDNINFHTCLAVAPEWQENWKLKCARMWYVF
jgi:hypothetical protein